MAQRIRLLVTAAVVLSAVVAPHAPAGSTCGVTRRGVTTYPMPPAAGGAHAVGFAVDPAHPKRFVVADATHLYGTVNGGCSWRTVWTMPSTADLPPGSAVVEVSPIVASAPYAFYLATTTPAGTTRLWRTTNNGESFAAGDGGLYPTPVTCWSYSPVDSATVYAVTAGDGYDRVFATSDGGAHWTESRRYTGVVHAACPLTAAADSATGFWLASYDSGSTGAATAATGEHPYSGLYRSRDRGATLTTVAATANTGRVQALALGRGTRGSSVGWATVDAAFQTRFYSSSDDGAHVREVPPPLGDLGCVTAAPTTGDVFVSIVNGDYSVGITTSVYRLPRGRAAFVRLATRPWTTTPMCRSGGGRDERSGDSYFRTVGRDLWFLQTPGSVVDPDKGSGATAHNVPDVLVAYAVGKP